MTVQQQAAEGERFAGRPVHALAAFDRLAAIVEKALDRLVNLEILRNGRDLLPDLPEDLLVHAGIAAARIVGIAARLQSGPAAIEPVGLVRLVALAGLMLGFE